jgi:hypothetical protein
VVLVARAVATLAAAPTVASVEAGYPPIYRLRKPRANRVISVWSRRTTKTPRASGRTASRRPTDGGEVIDTAIARYLDCASPRFSRNSVVVFDGEPLNDLESPTSLVEGC